MPVRHEVRCLFRCPALLGLVGGASGSCREARPPGISLWPVAKSVPRKSLTFGCGRATRLTRTSSPGRAAGQTIDRQLTGRRRAWRSHPISLDVSNFGRNSESRLPHRPKNLRDAMLFNQSPGARRKFQEGSDVHTLTGFRSGIGHSTVRV